MSDKKKLLFIVEAMGGGVFTYIVNLTNKLVNYYDVYIGYAVRPQTPADYMNYFDDRIHLVEIKNFTRSISVIKDIMAYFEIKKIVKVIQPDIIHLHSSKAGILGRWAINGKKVPLFYTPHGYSFLMSNYGKFKRTIYHMIERVSAKKYCTTISCSEGEHFETLKLTSNAKYINNGVDIDELDKILRRIDNASDKKFTVFTLGRICYQKNPELFNNIAKELPDVHFLWIGDGEMRDTLTSNNIEITGWVKREEALKRAYASDVFILTSLWEGLPISLLESMYMKKLCIVSNVIGNKDVLYTGVNGYVCNTQDDFVNAICAAHSECVSELINSAYSDIINIYNISVMSEEYRRVYETSK